MTRLAGPRVVLRPPTPADHAPLRAIHAEPSVARWWGEVREGFPATDDDESVRFAIEADGALAGMIQFWEETDPDYRYASVDVFLGAAFQGRGLGTEALALVVDHLVGCRGHHRVTIDPAVDNAPARRSYAKAGFREVGVLRCAWRDPAGTWRDLLLMEFVVPAAGGTPAGR